MKVIINRPPHIFQTSAYRAQDIMVDEFVDAKQYEQAIGLLNQMKQDFPDRKADIFGYLIWIFEHLNQPDKKMVEIIEAIEQKIFFKLDDEFFSNGLAHLAEFQKFQQISKVELAKLAQKTESKLELYMPSDCFNGELMLILHGDGSTNLAIQDIWPPKPYLENGVAVAYLQSPIHGGSHHYFWTADYEQSRKAIECGFGEIKQQLNVDISNVTLAGFSGGAMAAMSAVTHGVVKPKQVLAFMPHNGDYIGKVANEDLPIHIYKAEFDKNIDDLLMALKPLVSLQNSAIRGVSHDLPSDMASYILPHLNKPD